jgi:hypothetical protein
MVEYRSIRACTGLPALTCRLYDLDCLEDEEPGGAMEATVNLDVVIGRFAAFAFNDSTQLAAAGIESLAMLRLAVEVATDGDAEIDASGLAGLRTVGDLKRWLGALASDQASDRVAGSDSP